MTVQQLMDKLKELPPGLPVCLDDWTEQWIQPSEEAAERIKLVVCGRYRKAGTKGYASGDFVCIG